MVTLPSVQWVPTPPLWHFDAVMGGGVHPIALRSSGDQVNGPSWPTALLRRGIWDEALAEADHFILSLVGSAIELDHGRIGGTDE
jgi:hypothetical protein